MTRNKKVIACYIRLSEDDEETAKGIKDESNSVSSQRNLIRSYIDRDSDFKGYGISEYVDDGFTGTTFTRPGFEAVLANVNMMAEIYAGKRSGLKSSGNAGAELEKKLTLLQKEQERLSARKVRLYEEYRSGGSREGYISKKQQTDERLSEIETELNDLEQRLEAAKRSEKDISQTEMVLSEVSAIDRFDKETLKKIIDRINVYSENEIEIIWKPLDVIFDSISADKGIIEIS